MSLTTTATVKDFNFNIQLGECLGNDRSTSSVLDHRELNPSVMLKHREQQHSIILASHLFSNTWLGDAQSTVNNSTRSFWTLIFWNCSMYIFLYIGHTVSFRTVKKNQQSLVI